MSNDKILALKHKKEGLSINIISSLFSINFKSLHMTIKGLNQCKNQLNFLRNSGSFQPVLKDSIKIPLDQMFSDE